MPLAASPLHILVAVGPSGTAWGGSLGAESAGPCHCLGVLHLPGAAEQIASSRPFGLHSPAAAVHAARPHSHADASWQARHTAGCHQLAPASWQGV